MHPAMVMAVAIRPGQTTTAAATARGLRCHTTALTATTHGPTPAIQTALTPRPASLHSLALPRITPAAGTHLLPMVITSSIRPVTPAVAFLAVPFPLAAAPTTPAAAHTIPAAVPAASAEALVAAPHTTPAVASAVEWVAHPPEAPASAAAPTTAATHRVAVRQVDLAALPATPAAVITAAATTMACIEVRSGLQDMRSNQRPETFSGRFVCSPGSAEPQRGDPRVLQALMPRTVRNESEDQREDRQRRS